MPERRSRKRVTGSPAKEDRMRSIRPVSAQVPDLLLAVTLFVAGCSSMGNTLAQDLAWQRWEKCKHFPTIKLKEIKTRSEEHTSELQSQSNLVCRLLLEKKKIDD